MNPERGGPSIEVSNEINSELFDRLYTATMANKWDQVVTILKENKIDHATKLTKSLETPLHVAISSYHLKTRSSYEQHVTEMIQVMKKKGTLASVLASQNQRGDTPLHVSAAVGWLRIFDSVEHDDDPDRLLHNRNKKGETTPLFLAALHGNLAEIRRLLDRFNKLDLPLLRRIKDGNTILHRAIFEENFELAYMITEYYPKMVESINVIGESPLHVLAKKPNVFKSSSHLRIYDSIIYYCVFVEKLSKRRVDPTAAKENNLKYPENYTTCVKIFSFIRGSIVTIFKKRPRPSCASVTKNTDLKGKSYHDLFPYNYVTCIDLFELAMKVILIILGVGIERVRKIIEKKTRYLNAIDVLDKMLENESGYKYDNTGQRPQIDPQEDFGKIVTPKTPPEFGNDDTTTPTTAPTSSTVSNVNDNETAQNKQACEELSSTHCYNHHNTKGETPGKIFTQTHEDLFKSGNEWLVKTSESCSVVAALIATVAFATSATVPGGLDQTHGYPILRDRRAFDIFSIASLIALCLSITALLFFLAIITLRFEESDFMRSLPMKLLMGLTCLFSGIAAMLLSFCAGHTFILREKLSAAAVPIYSFAMIPIMLFAIRQLALYFDLFRAAFIKVPQRSYKVFDL